MKLLVVANWKMNPLTLKEAELLFGAVKRGVKNIQNVEVVVCPPFIFIPKMRNEKQNMKIGAQDCSFEERGAFTGEISPSMLRDFNCEYVIIGHSERRKYNKETDEMVNKKVKAALAVGLKPILCVGSQNRNQEKEFKDIQTQLEMALSGIKKPNPQNLIITYEPVWAISTTKNSKITTPVEAKEGAYFIRGILSKLFGKNFTQKIKIIYGGSVDSKNILGFIKEAKMAGALIGAASLNSQEFVTAVKRASRP